MKLKTYDHICVGYEGHECGAITKRRQRSLAHGNNPRCPDCLKAHKKLYQVDYYLAHNEKAREYQRQYNIAHKKKNTTRRNNNFRAQYSTTAKQQEREERRSVYHHSDLMHRPTESFEKAVGRILNGDADLTGVR